MCIRDRIRTTPKIGAYVKTPQGKGNIIDMNLLTGELKIRMEQDPAAAPATFHKSQVKVLRDGQDKHDKPLGEKTKKEE